MENSRIGEICNVSIRRASFVKLLRSKKQTETKKNKKERLHQKGYLKKNNHLLKTKLKQYVNLKQ